MKTIACAVILILVTTTTSCDESHATQSHVPPGPDPVKVLEEKVETERQLRQEAEALAAEQAAGRGNWQLASLGLCLFAVAAFIGGTAIGTRGRYHASVTS